MKTNHTDRSQGRLPRVPPVDLGRLKPSDFADDELDLPFYLVHLHEVGNSIVETGANRGFIDISVWRDKKDNNADNARVMENCLSLAFFYCTNRPWNSYYSTSALKERLEAALEFWCGMQQEDGTFVELRHFKHERLAATAFGARCMGQILLLLTGGPTPSQHIIDRLVETRRRAVRALLTNPDFYKHGRSFANQYAPVWSCALALLAISPDPELKTLLEKRIRQSTEDFQSPAGYFYEMDGPDWAYNLYVHTSELHYALQYAKGTPLEDVLLKQIRIWHEWLSFNAVREPDGTGYYLNGGIETRQRLPFLAEEASAAYHEFSDGEHVESVRAFAQTRDAYRLQVNKARLRLEQEWPAVKPLVVGAPDTYAPGAFLHRGHVEWHPSGRQKAEAVTKLPYLNRDRFVHQRTDARYPVVFTYVRRPGYYAAFTSGQILPVIRPYVPRSQQRYGLGIVWTPGMGTVLQTQSRTDDAAWGTTCNDRESVYEADSFSARFSIGGTLISSAPGCCDLPEGVLGIEYPLGERGGKQLTFTDDGIDVSIRHHGDFIEQIPLLMDCSDRLEYCGEMVTLRRDRGSLCITHDQDARVAERKTEHQSGSRKVVCLFMKSGDKLEYRVAFSNREG